jgi:hypothetical protein
MTMTTFAAAPGMMLVSLDPADPEYPILGWLHTTGLNVLPLVIGHPGPMVSGEAIRFPDDMVYDPASTMLFSDAESWRDDFEAESRYRPGTVIGHAAPPAAPPVAVVAPAAPKLPVAAKAPGGALAFDGKTYAKASFWKVEIGGESFVINMPPDHRAPTGPVEKITREVFFELRKSIPETTVEAILNPGTPEPQPEEPEADEDDGDDLI